MTPQAYKALAVANGYDLGSKTDAELLADYAFHKAACVGKEIEVFCRQRNELSSIAVPHEAHRVRFMMALDGLDLGKPEEKIWEEVCQGRPTWSEAHDKDGKLLPF